MALTKELQFMLKYYNRSRLLLCDHTLEGNISIARTKFKIYRCARSRPKNAIKNIAQRNFSGFKTIALYLLTANGSVFLFTYK